MSVEPQETQPPATSLDARYAVRADEVAARRFDDEVVVVHLGTCTYYSASGSGADAWSGLEEGRPVGEVAAGIAEQYGIETARAVEDLQAFVARLLEEGLVAPLGGEERGPDRPAPARSPNGRAYQAPELHAYRDMADLLALDPPLPELDRPAWRAAGDDGRQ